jgi:hypothetical protein
VGTSLSLAVMLTRLTADRRSRLLRSPHSFSLPHIPIFRIILNSGTRQPSFFGGKEFDLSAENLELKFRIDS